MSMELKITRLRQLPLNTFRSITLNDTIPNEKKDRDEFPCEKRLLFDLPSLLEAHKRGVIPHLTDNYCMNSILISELLLHQLDKRNKDAQKVLRKNDSSTDVVEAQRLRDLLDFIFLHKNEKWMIFQQKGVNEHKGFLRDLGLEKDLLNEHRYISWALYMKENSCDNVLYITENDKLRKCAQEKGVSTTTATDFFK
ncbi:uncharacterized protein TM35_000401660 [Trypanosoma theileri]|uniref:Uncharacterized protein n=1 Tax=Trypanosoma theileri TaxID=67003 RepID=A0A1X0NL70_9TRYP|nr:uncharacterized protein TM35_000401660 [Trypanosoma theileri]ORC84899.1 hypothetical protein TM35_000401660 [Trypanosoma theileri]